VIPDVRDEVCRRIRPVPGRLGQSRRFPAWRQRTGSAVLMCPMVWTDQADLRQSPPVEKTPRHTGNHLRQLLPVYRRHAGKHSGRSETTLQNTSMKFVCSATLLRWAAAPLICPTAIMAVTARPKIVKSENAVPPRSVCPFAATRREAIRPLTLWKGSTPALDSSPCAVRRRGYQSWDSLGEYRLRRIGRVKEMGFQLLKKKRVWKIRDSRV